MATDALYLGIRLSTTMILSWFAWYDHDDQSPDGKG